MKKVGQFSGSIFWMRFVRATFLSALFLIFITASLWAEKSATISGNATVCEDAPSPSVTFTGFGGTAPYTFTYNINDGVDLVAVSDGNGEAIVLVPTDNAGNYEYALVSVDDNLSEPETASGIVNITITSNVLPTFTALGPYCEGDIPGSLPAISIEGITGTWSPITINTATAGSTDYTFTPDAGQCATTTTMEVLVNPLPEVNIIGNSSICIGATTTLSPITGGTWISSDPSVAMVTSAGVVTGVTDGTATFSFTSGSTSCSSTTSEITVIAINTVGAASSTPTLCINTNLPEITHTTIGAAGVGAASDLPDGVTASWADNTITINGTPTEAGIFEYSIPLTGGCGTVSATGRITVTAVPAAIISYTVSSFCTSVTTAQGVTISGTGSYTGGTYSASPAGLSINSETGAITPSTSSPNSYTVTYTIPASGGCPAVPVTTNVTITALPTASISYTGSPWCTTAGTQSVALTGNGDYTGGTYSASPAGLNINSSTGLITPASSTAGTYTVSYAIVDTGGCGEVTATAEVTINTIPVIGSVNHTDVTVCSGSDGTITIVATGYAPLSYSINGGTDFIANGGLFTGLGNGTYNVAVRNGYGCVTIGGEVTVNDGGAPQPPAAGDDATYCFGGAMDDLTATASAGGTLTWYSDSGLTNVLGTGATLTPLNNVGTTIYYVTETSGGCESTATQVTITITAVPTAIISYAGSPYCTSGTTVQAVTVTGTGAYTGGVYTVAPAGLTINSSTGAMTPSTSSPNSYTVTYTIPASGGCPAVPVTTDVTITALPTAIISYTGSPWCTTAGTQSVALTGNGDYTGGTYSASPAGLNINSSTGLITPGSSTAGTYTVTYSITASGGCETVVAITSVSVTALPGAAGSISGPASFTPGTTGIDYSVSPITAATSYIWNYSGSGVTIHGSGASVTLDFSPTASSGTLSVFGRNICSDGATSTLSLSPSIKTLTLTSVLLEGLYNGGGTMREVSNADNPQYPGIADRITVELHNAASYSTVSYSVSNVDLSLDGTATIIVPAAFSGSYYITVKHRNSLETTTSSPVSFADPSITRSFATRANVFGGNLKSSGDGHYLIYGADVNQDGIVDTGDMNFVDNGSTAILIGYNVPDANGDGIVDTSDMNMVDNNSTAIVMIKLPF